MTTLRLPLFASLAQLLIAYTQDFDAELDRTIGQADNRERPPSLAMWANVLRFVGDEGLELTSLSSLSGIAKPSVTSMVGCLQRHGWITIDSKRVIRLTAHAEKARRAWSTTLDAVEQEWGARYGNQTIDTLRAALEAVTSQLARNLPQYPMPAPHRGAFPTGE